MAQGLRRILTHALEEATELQQSIQIVGKPATVQDYKMIAEVCASLRTALKLL